MLYPGDLICSALSMGRNLGILPSSLEESSRIAGLLGASDILYVLAECAIFMYVWFWPYLNTLNGVRSVSFECIVFCYFRDSH